MSKASKASKPSSDLASRAGAEQYVKNVLERAGKQFAELGCFPLQAHVFATRAPGQYRNEPPPPGGVGIVLVMPDGLPDNDAIDSLGVMLRDMVSDTRAIGVLVAYEAWFVVDDERGFDKPIDKHPDRKEVVIATLEHIRVPKPLSWRALITRPAPPARPRLEPFRPVVHERVRTFRNQLSALFGRERFE